MARALHLSKEGERSVIAALRGLLESKELIVERVETVHRALRRVAGGADFADALISEFGVEADCQHTVTFDRGAARLAGMRLLN